VLVLPKTENLPPGILKNHLLLLVPLGTVWVLVVGAIHENGNTHAQVHKVGLAQELFEAEVVEGQWWAETSEGTLHARQTAAQFDWDHKKEAKHILPAPADPRSVVGNATVDLRDLLRKLGGVDALTGAFDRAFLGSPLVVGERKDILFEVYGTDRRLLPDELAELAPVLERACPELFGRSSDAPSRVVRLRSSPVESLATAFKELSSPYVSLGPASPLRRRVEHLAGLVEGSQAELTEWLDSSVACQPVVGPTQRHFDALREMCRELEGTTEPRVLLTTSFLNESNLSEPDGLAEAMAAAPASTQFTVVYGHASDDLPEQQAQDMAVWAEALEARCPALAGRVQVVAGERRSHEKVVITSLGAWMVGSWNAGSSRPHATVFESSLRGRDSDTAQELLTRIAINIPAPHREPVSGMLAPSSKSVAAGARPECSESMHLLLRAVTTLTQAVPHADGVRSETWHASLKAVCAALQPFLTAARVDIVDEQQTRDAFMSLIRSAKRDVLVASDRLTETALDPATLRDLAGESGSTRVLRLVWGREWVGRRAPDAQTRAQLQRARQTVQDARERLGGSFCTSDDPMENHAKMLLVDGLRGLVTSENVLAYGGEKSKYESREIGVLFWGPVVARHILGRVLYQWSAALAGDQHGDDRELLWAVAGNEAWHSLRPLDSELDFNWRSPEYIERVLFAEATGPDDDVDAGEEHAEAWRDLVRRAGPHPFQWVHAEAQRAGLVVPDTGGRWHPYDSTDPTPLDPIVKEAERLVARESGAGATPAVVGLGGGSGRAIDPRIESIAADIVLIPAGSFLMGDDRVAIERPRHRVRITRPFLLGRTPVTQALWRAVMGSLPHLRDVERNPEYPVIHISRADMLAFIDRLNNLPGGGGFALPTEAQWEYACRAGADTAYCFGDDPGRGDGPGMLEQYAWTKRNSQARLQKVRQLRPNAFGLFDMHGLVYETMQDGFRTYTSAAVNDPVGPLTGDRFVAKGGFWGRYPVDPRNPAQEHFRCASRQTYESSHRVSFRLARERRETP
jgi:formylglycine-generating enzyme required for sulfatase activity